jgi:hypothetical protein
MNIDWLKAIQLKPRYLFGLLMFGFLLLWLPDKQANFLGIKIFRDEFRGWIGVGTLGAMCFWFVALLPILNERNEAKKERASILERLNSLNREEHQIISYCLRRGQASVNLDLVTMPWHSSLSQKGLLIQASGYGDQTNWSFSIPDFVWKYLEKNGEEFLERFDHPDELPRNRLF